MSGVYKRVAFALMAMAVLAVFLTGCGRGSVAKVNGRKITREEYHGRLERLPVPAGNQLAEAGALVLAKLIDEELLLGLAKEKKVSPTDKQVNERYAEIRKQSNFKERLKQTGLTVDQFKEMLRVEQAAFNLQTMGVEVTDKEVKDYYEKHKNDQFTSPEMAFVAVIATNNKADADKAMTMLKKGVSFETVVDQISTDARTKANKGMLPGPIVRGAQGVPKPIEDAVFKLKEKEFSQPVSLEKGQMAIFKMVESRKKRTQPFHEVSYPIRQELMRQKGVEKNDLQKDLIEFREKANIDVKIERFKKVLLQKPDAPKVPGPDDIQPKDQ